MAEDIKKAQPLEYYREYLKNDVRPDGRELGECRPTAVSIGSIGTAHGSSSIRLGNTLIQCAIKGELTVPTSEEPKCGFIVPNLDLPPLCSPQFKPGPPPERAQVLSQLLADILTCSKCVDLHQLSIMEGKWAWVLYCDLLCLNMDGNLIDACITAITAAFQTVRLPTIVINKETGQPVVDLTEKRSLTLACKPIALTYTIFDHKILLVDPNQEEEMLSTGCVTIVTTEDKLCAVYKPGGSAISWEQLKLCVHRAQERGVEIRKVIQDIVNNSS